MAGGEDPSGAFGGAAVSLKGDEFLLFHYNRRKRRWKRKSWIFRHRDTKGMKTENRVGMRNQVEVRERWRERERGGIKGPTR